MLGQLLVEVTLGSPCSAFLREKKESNNNKKILLKKVLTLLSVSMLGHIRTNLL